MYFRTISALLLIASTEVMGHMHLYWPPTLKGDNNPYTQGQPDSKLNYPYGCCGQTNKDPCKGHLGLLDTDEGKPVVQWQAGAKVNFTLSGHAVENTDWNPEGGTHWGGSCQVGFSTDKGKTFKVATTWQGNCPLRENGIDPSKQVFDFTVPADIPAGNAVFAWTWVNREAEFNMNCASVTIASAGGNKDGPPEDEPPTETEPPTDNEPSKVDPDAPTPTDSSPQPDETQYTLKDCSCKCPSLEVTDGCVCSCDSPSSKRHLAERKALSMHKHAIRRHASLKAPIRRAEKVKFTSRPDMLFLDFPGADCKSQKTQSELEFPDPGPDVVPGDGTYELLPPNCS